jgi:hypothetical protein
MSYEAILTDCIAVSDIQVNLTPLSQMNSEAFARKMTGGEALSGEQKKQIREQQEVSCYTVINVIQICPLIIRCFGHQQLYLPSFCRNAHGCWQAEK